MAGPTSRKVPAPCTGLLGCYIVASMTFYGAGVAQFLDSYFNPNHHADAPFDFDLEFVGRHLGQAGGKKRRAGEGETPSRL